MSLLDSKISILILSDGPDSDMPSNVITLIPFIWQHGDFPEKEQFAESFFTWQSDGQSFLRKR